MIHRQPKYQALTHAKAQQDQNSRISSHAGIHCTTYHALLSFSYRYLQPPNDSACSNNMTMNTTLTMYTCPSSPIGSNTCVGDDEQEMANEDEEGESEYQTDTESWV